MKNLKSRFLTPTVSMIMAVAVMMIALLTVLGYGTGCESSFEVDRTDTNSPDDELLSLIEQLDPVGMVQVSRRPNGVLPSMEPGDTGILSNGVYWRNISERDAWGIGFAGLSIQYKTAAVTIDCQVKTSAGKIKKAQFAGCVADLIGECDGADVYNDNETGYTNAEGYNNIYDDGGNVIGREECNFPED